MITLLLGSGTGLGLCLLAAGLASPPRPLAAVLAAHNAPATPHTPTHTTQPHGRLHRLQRPGIRLLRSCGLPTARTRRDLSALDHAYDLHLATQTGATLVGCLVTLPVCGMLAATRLSPISTSLIVTLLGAAIGFATPTLKVRAAAARRRGDAQHAVSSFLNLVVVSLAGGAGVEQALSDSAHCGTGPTYRDIGYALEHARLARIPAWDTLTALGDRLGVPPLNQLAATVGLAGTEGAKVRDSLRSRAHSLTTSRLTETEAHASAATERMSLPVVALFAGFLLFLGYPAVAAVTSGL